MGFYIAYFRDYHYVTLYLIAINLTLIIYSIVNLPFTNSYQNYQSNICHLTEFIIIIVANYYLSLETRT